MCVRFYVYICLVVNNWCNCTHKKTGTEFVRIKKYFMEVWIRHDSVCIDFLCFLPRTFNGTKTKSKCICYITQAFIFSAENGDTSHLGGRPGVHGLPAGSGKFNLFLTMYTKTLLTVRHYWQSSMTMELVDDLPYCWLLRRQLIHLFSGSTTELKRVVMKN